jgi:hypothetical protein
MSEAYHQAKFIKNKTKAGSTPFICVEAIELIRSRSLDLSAIFSEKEIATINEAYADPSNISLAYKINPNTLVKVRAVHEVRGKPVRNWYMGERAYNDVIPVSYEAQVEFLKALFAGQTELVKRLQPLVKFV